MGSWGRGRLVVGALKIAQFGGYEQLGAGLGLEHIVWLSQSQDCGVNVYRHVLGQGNPL